jgi:hypothetical protein
MPDKESTAQAARPSSLELTEELIRKRAYDFYEQRGRENGHDLEDWFKAEAEIMGKRTILRAAPEEAAPEELEEPVKTVA